MGRLARATTDYIDTAVFLYIKAVIHPTPDTSSDVSHAGKNIDEGRTGRTRGSEQSLVLDAQNKGT